MKHEKLERALEELGLEKNEAKIYLALLGAGPSNVLALSRLAGMKRSNIYNLLDRIIDLGLARIEPKGFKRLFVAEDPENLKVLLQRKKKALEETLPFLQELAKNKGGTSFIKYYQGLNAIREMYEGVLKELRPKDYYLAMSNQEAWEGLDPDFFPHFQVRRGKLPISIRLILQKNPSAERSYEFQKNVNAHIRLLGEGTLLNSSLIVLPHKVIINQLVNPPISIVIENENVVKMHKEMFEIIWDSLPE